MVKNKPVEKAIGAPKLIIAGAVIAAVVFINTVPAADVLSHNLIVPAVDDATNTPVTVPAPVFKRPELVLLEYPCIILESNYSVAYDSC